MTKFYLGIDFLDAVKVHLVRYTDTLCIMEMGQPCNVPVKRGIDEGNMLFALQFSKGIKKNESTFLATLKIGEELKEAQAPKAIQKVLGEFKDVMLAKLPKKLPSRRGVDRAMKIES